MIIPRVHRNGTSRDELLKQLADARQAIDQALEAMARATPHGRDYYVIGDRAIIQAREEHFARVAKLSEVLTELETISEGIDAQEARG